MSDPWDENWQGEGGQDQSGPWAEDWPDAENTSQSGQAAKKLTHIYGQTGEFIGLAEAATSVVTGLGAMAHGGIAGTVYGAVPGLEEGAAAGVAEGVMESETYQPRTVAGERYLGYAGKAGEAALKGLKYVGSGYAGMAALAGGADIEEAEQSRQDFMNTPNAIGEGVFDATGSPMAATIATLLPELAALGFTPSKGVPKPRQFVNLDDMKPGRIDTPEGYGGSAIPETQARPWNKADLTPAEQSVFSELEAAVAARDAERVSSIVNANPAIVAAFDELGIQYAPQMVSESVALRQTASGLKSGADSGLAAMDDRVFAQLREASDEMINRYGTTDRAQVDLELREAFDVDNVRLTNLADDAFKEIKDAIPQGERINVSKARDYIEERISQLGSGDLDEGLSRASRHEKSLWNLTHKRIDIDGVPAWEEISPSYSAVDAYRKNIGKGIDERGIFKDGDQGELKHIYGLTADAQQQAANKFGVGNEYKQANQHVIERKASEASSETVLGRRMERGANIEPVAMALVKGNTGPFKRLMENTPEAQRPMVASSVLDKIIIGSGKGPGMSEGFLKSIELLERNPTARQMLFANLPKEIVQRYRVIETAAKGFIRSLAKDNRSNTANANNVLKAWESGGLWAKMAGYAEGIPFAGDWVKKMFETAPTRRTKAAETFLTSKGLSDAVREYGRGQQARADKIAMASPAYKRWLATVEADVRITIQRDGLMAFLFVAGAE